MATRQVKSDGQGLYVLLDRRKYRPQSGTTSYQRGDNVTLWHSRTYAKQKTPHTVQFYLPTKGSENWQTTDPYIPPRQKAKPVKPGENQIEIRKNYKGCQVLITVAERKARHAGRIQVTPLALSMNATAAITWDEWDQLVKEINEAREDVPVAGIVAKLKQEVALDDELQAYIKEKGLA